MSTSTERMAALRARRREEGLPLPVENRDVVRARVARFRALKARGASPLTSDAQEAKPKRQRKKRGPLPFMGIDGEGAGTDEKGRQLCMLLTAGNDDEVYELYTGQHLRTGQILNFICNLPQDVKLVAYSMGYDISMWLRDLNYERRDKVLHAEKIYGDPKPAEPEWNPETERFERPYRSNYIRWTDPDTADVYGIDYQERQYFTVTRMHLVPRTSLAKGKGRPLVGPDGKPLVRWAPVPDACRTIYETFGFFQRKFARALQDHDIGTKAERRLIAKNKAERASFSRMTREIRDYCGMECALLARLMEKLRDVWTELDLIPNKPNGPGKLAKAALKKWHVMKADELEMLPRISGVLMHAEAAYFGGRFELQRHGRVPGPIYEYDINSAYPAEMLTLPCLSCGRWEYLTGEEIRKVHLSELDAIYVAAVRYEHRLPWGLKTMCGLPHRQSGREPGRKGLGHAGSICWPMQGQGTYWSVEIRSAEALGCRCVFGSGWRYHKQCDCKSFPDLPALYAERKRLGDSTAGYFLKITINALYGVQVQQVGMGPYRNPIWGGLITAGVRAKLNRAIAQAPEAICMIATDGLYSTSPLDLPTGEDMGLWKPKLHPHGLFLVQPGIYWDDKLAAIKTRGVSAGFFAPRRRRERFEKAWQSFVDADIVTGCAPAFPEVALGMRRFVGLAEANARKQPDLAGMWLDSKWPKTHPNYLEPRRFSFDWTGKRGGRRWEGSCARTLPLSGGPDWISATYADDPTLAAEWDMQAMELEDQPDYVTMAAYEPD